MTEFSLRLEGSMDSPAFMACMQRDGRTSALPFTVIAPASMGDAPNSACISSLLPAP